MTVLFEDEAKDAGFDFDCQDLAERAVKACMACPYEAEVGVTLVDAARIREMNREYRHIDRPTDVLSFPMLEYAAPEDFSHVTDDDFNPDSGELILGDIVLCAEKIKEQAAEYGHSELREFAFLIVHSMLHLFGYDHESDAEREAMEQRQREIMDALEIAR